MCPAYDIENYNQKDLGASAMRQKFNAIVTAQDMADTYLPPFRGCVVEAKGAAIMCSYNAVNGVASCGNAKIQNEILRGQFGFDGYIVSDCGGVGDLGNARYPASQQCIANVDGKPFNDNRSSCFLPPLPEKGQTVAGVAMNAGVSTHLHASLVDQP